MSEDTGCEERGAVGAAERGGSGEEGAGEKDGAGGIPSMEKGSALQERSGERRQGKEDRGSAGEGLSQGGAPYQWAAGGGVTRLTADGTGRRALESSCDCDRALCLLSLVGRGACISGDWREGSWQGSLGMGFWRGQLG